MPRRNRERVLIGGECRHGHRDAVGLELVTVGSRLILVTAMPAVAINCNGNVSASVAPRS